MEQRSGGGPGRPAEIDPAVDVRPRRAAAATGSRPAYRLKRGQGASLPYTLEDVRQRIRDTLEAAAPCLYCLGTLTLKNLTMDHTQPLSRDGQHALTNLVVCCEGCNRAKGLLDEEEFQELMKVMANWPEEARKDLLARLRAGGRVYR